MSEITWDIPSREVSFERMRQDGRIPASVLAGLNHPKNTTSLDVVDQHLPKVLREGRCLILCGDPDSSKTFALWYAATLCRHMPSPMALREGTIAAPVYHPLPWYGYFVHARNLEANLSSLAMQNKLVLIDDLGVEDLGRDRYKLPDYEWFFDERYSQRYPTVISTNIDFTPGEHGEPSDFQRRYGDRITSRLREWADIYSLPTEGLR